MNTNTTSELESWIRLCTIPGIGGETQRKLLQAFGTPEEVLSASRSSLRAVIAEKADRLLAHDNKSVIETCLRWVQTDGNQIVTLGDPSYPQKLLEITDPPTLLFVRGNIRLLNEPAIAIVGSRHASQPGKQTAKAFAKSLGEAGYCVISGLAAGIDAAAHEGAVNTAGSTIAVTGTGPDRLYPASNQKLAEQILQHGLLITEFAPGTPALPANFPRRNRIIAGMSKGVLVVEAALESGSLITARLALETGREVMAIPGSIHSPVAKGCHRLIKQGAKLVETVEDVLEEIGRLQSPTPLKKHVQPPVQPALISSTAQQLLDAIDWEPTLLDEIVARTGMGIGMLLSELLSLEMQGLICNLQGDRYQRTKP